MHSVREPDRLGNMEHGTFGSVSRLQTKNYNYGIHSRLSTVVRYSQNK